MQDSFLQFSKVAQQKSNILEQLHLSKGQYLLATLHRARNTDNKENLESIIEAFLSIEEKIVFPVHPRTQQRLQQFGLLTDSLAIYPECQSESQSESQSSPYPIPPPHLLLIPPVGYLDSIVLTRNAKKVLTDSGGLQKEAYFSQVPCVTLDEATGWPETVEDGWNILAGSDKEKIIEAAWHFEPTGKQRHVFGHGKAAERIVGILACSV